MARTGPLWIGLGALLLASPLLARTLEITRNCLPGFCVESREAFTVLARHRASGKYRLLLSRTQAVLYLEASTSPPFPFCAHCTLEERAGERIARHVSTGRVMERLIGPLKGCADPAPFFVHVLVYVPGADLGSVSVERACR